MKLRLFLHALNDCLLINARSIVNRSVTALPDIVVSFAVDVLSGAPRTVWKSLRLHIRCFWLQLGRILVAVALLGLVPALLVHLLLEEPLGHSHGFKQVVYAHALLDILKGFL